MDERRLGAVKRRMGGLLGDDPALRLGLGLCPALAVATTAWAGLGVGAVIAGVLTLTRLVMGLIGGAIPEKARVPATLVVGAALAAVAQMLLEGWFPALHAALGDYAPLAAIHGLALIGGERVAGEGAGAIVARFVGGVLAVTLFGAARELMGRGALFGAAILPAGFEPARLAALPAGGLIALGICMGAISAMRAGGRGERERA